MKKDKKKQRVLIKTMLYMNYYLPYTLLVGLAVSVEGLFQQYWLTILRSNWKKNLTHVIFKSWNIKWCQRFRNI